MAEVTFCRPTAEHAAELARDMSPDDRAELAACGCTDARAVVQDCVQASTWCVAAVSGGRLLALFGVAPLRRHLLLEDTGMPWLLGTAEMRQHARKLTALPASYIALMLETYPHLVNFVHADNHRAVRWLQHLGFALAAPAPYGPLAAPFRRFEMHRPGGHHV